jgi:hypothetical protein
METRMADDLLSYCDGGVGFNLGGSREAAERIAPKVEVQRAAVLRVIAEAGSYGATGDEIAAKLDWLVYAVRPRTSDLRKESAIFDSQRRRPNPGGTRTIVWVTRDHLGTVTIGEAA